MQDYKLTLTSTLVAVKEMVLILSCTVADLCISYNEHKDNKSSSRCALNWLVFTNKQFQNVSVGIDNIDNTMICNE